MVPMAVVPPKPIKVDPVTETYEGPEEEREAIRAILRRRRVTFVDIVSLRRRPNIVLAREEVVKHLIKKGYRQAHVAAMIKRTDAAVWQVLNPRDRAPRPKKDQFELTAAH